MSSPPRTNPLPAQLNPEGAPRVGTAVLQQRFQFTGPLPPPGILEQYEKLCPGITTRLVDAAYAEGQHRQGLENKTLDANIEAMRRQFAEARLGQIFAFAIAVTFVLVGAYVTLEGHPWPGTILGGVGLGGIVTAFIVGRDKRQQPAPEPKEE